MPNYTKWIKWLNEQTVNQIISRGAGRLGGYQLINNIKIVIQNQIKINKSYFHLQNYTKLNMIFLGETQNCDLQWTSH